VFCLLKPLPSHRVTHSHKRVTIMCYRSHKYQRERTSGRWSNAHAHAKEPLPAALASRAFLCASFWLTCPPHAAATAVSLGLTPTRHGTHATHTRQEQNSPEA
jgi:hypothetical protein